MKKLLLFALLVASTMASAWAVTDGVNYERVNGIGIKNMWIQDRAHTADVWSNRPYCNTSARTAVMNDGFIYIARSNANTVIQGTDTLSQSVIYKVDATNGELVKELQLTLDGNIYGGATLSSNTVGVDNFGHLYMAPFSSNLATVQPVYLVDKETGELTFVAELDKGDALQRCDYIDVMGDLTLEEAECNIMSVGASSEYIYRWHADQGGDWEGGFDGDPYLAIIDFYPETVTQWGYAPVAKMVLGEDEPAEPGTRQAAEAEEPYEADDSGETTAAVPEMVITIPPGVGLDTLRIAMESGDLCLSDITANSVTIQSGGGNLTLRDVSLGTVDIYTEDGAVSMEESTFGSLNIGMGEGEVSVCSDDGLSGCRIELKTGNGEITYNGEAAGAQFLQPGNGKRFLTVQIGSGDIRIDG